MKKLKTFANYKYINIILVFTAIILAFLFEFSFGNLAYYTNDFKGTAKVDFKGKQEENNYIIDIDTPLKYIKELELNTINTSGQSILFETFYLDESGKENIVSNDEKVSDVYNGLFSINIKKKTNHLKLVFKDVTSDQLKLNDLQVTNNFQFNFLRFLVISAAIYLIIDFIKILLADKKPKLHLYFLKVSLIVGSLVTLLSPFYYSLDEKEHFVRAYNVSERNFIKVKNDLVKWPKDLGPVIENPDSIFTPTNYTSYIINIKYLNSISKDNIIYDNHNSTAEPYLFFAYLGSGLGILTAKIFGLSFPFQFFLGRLFNVILYSFIVCLAIKLSGKYKKLLFIIGLLPAILFQSASFSADVMTNAFALLSVGLTINYKNRKKKVGVKDILLLSGCYILSFISKIAYFPLTLLIYLIPNKQFENEKLAKKAKIFVPIAGVIIFGLATIYAQKMNVVQWAIEGVNLKGQVKYIITHPIGYLYTLYNTLQEQIVPLIMALTSQMGYCGMLGNIDFLIIIILFVIGISSTENDIRTFDKVILFLIVGLCFGASISSLYLSYTPVGSNIVMGYQGRYLAPMLLPLLLIFVSDKFKLSFKTEHINNIVVLTMILLNIHMFLFIFMKFYF